MISNAFAGHHFLKFIPRIFSVSLACISVVGLAQAQSGSLSSLAKGMSADQLMQMQQSRGSSSEAQVPRQVMVQPPTLTPEQIAKQSEPSELEKIYSKRAGTPLKEFGYEQLGTGKPVVLTQVGGVVNNYVLGVGDEIVVSLRGQENNQYRVRVNRAGQVILPRMSPVSAAGRTFGDFQADLKAAISRAYVSTQAFISIGELRQINVLVSGQVHVPGLRTLTGLSTVVDAVLMSGGVRRDGSLRNVEIQRGSRILHVDLYSVLAGDGSAANMTLEDGDRVIVPSVGQTFAVTGDLHRSGIFELPASTSAISLKRAMALAGNALVPGVYRISLLRQDVHGETQLVDVTNQKNAVIRGGDVVSVKLVSDIAMNQISLRGAVLSPGIFSLKKYRTLHDMLPSADVFSHDAYMLFGYIDRINHVSHQHVLVPFSPKHIVEGKENIRLQNDDRVIVLSLSDEQAMVRDVMRRVQAQQAFNTTGDRSLLEQENLTRKTLTEGASEKRLGYHGDISEMTKQSKTVDDRTTNQIMGKSDAALNRLSSAESTQDSAKSGLALPTNSLPQQMASSGNSFQNDTMGSNDTQNAFNTDNKVGSNAVKQMQLAPLTMDQRLAQLAIYYRASIEGAVEVPGVYLIAPGTNLNEAIVAAGGLSPDADRSSVEVTSSKLNSAAGTSATMRKNYSIANPAQARKIRLQPRDSIVFHKVYTNRTGGTVTILGQVQYPGTYTLLRGERLSSVLMRAGGLTASAYPYGTVFLRQSLASLEQAAHRREAKQLESMLIVSMSRVSKSSQMQADSFTALQGYVKQLANGLALGRMSVSADPAALAANPESDPVMEAGDKVIIPKRPFTVSVMGEVLQPTSIPFKKGMTADDYIDQAGGLSQMADSDEIFVVLPDGSAYRADQSWFGLGEKDIPPGSMVYVGRDMSGYDLRQGVIDVTSIFSQMATSLAAIAAIND